MCLLCEDKQPGSHSNQPTVQQSAQHQGRGRRGKAGPARWYLSTDKLGTCLDFPHFIGLELWGAVVVNETNSSHQLGQKGSVVRARAHPPQPYPSTQPTCSVRSALGSLFRHRTHSHCDGHVSLCHSVHGRGDQWCLQRDLPGQGRCQVLRTEAQSIEQFYQQLDQHLPAPRCIPVQGTMRPSIARHYSFQLLFLAANPDSGTSQGVQ